MLGASPPAARAGGCCAACRPPRPPLAKSVGSSTPTQSRLNSLLACGACVPPAGGGGGSGSGDGGNGVIGGGGGAAGEEWGFGRKPGTAVRHNAFRRLLEKHIFCGMAGAVDRARVEASDVVEDLFNAGVRFAHLSRDNERRTKAFGHELGLETDWNSCIDLNEQSAAFSTQSSPTLGGGGVTKLPRGIGAVRPHLRDVDNVPLLVSMFCNCQPRTVREMVQIYQENCELVCVVGSCDAPLSASVFAQADIAVSVRPLAPACLWIGLEPPRAASRRRATPHLETPKAPRRARYVEAAAAGAGPAGGWGESELGAAEMLDSACCVAVLPDGHDLEQLTEWLLQGRSFLSNTRQAVFFGGFASIVLELLLIVADWTRLPPPQTPFQLLWVLLVVVPLLAFPLVLGPVDPRNKKEMVSKNEDHLANAPSAALYLVLRALPGAAGLCLLFAVFLDVAGAAAAAPPPPPPPTEGLWLSVLYVGEDQSAVPVAEAARLPGSLVERAGAEPREALALAHAQLLTQWWATLLLAAHSASFAHRTLNDSQYSPFANRLWVRAAALAFGLESVAVFVQLGPARIPAILGQIPWYGHLVGVGMMLLAGIVDWIVKRQDRRAFERTNKGMYLEFTTKLGMHSPIEPGHLAPTSYLDE